MEERRVLRRMTAAAQQGGGHQTGTDGRKDTEQQHRQRGEHLPEQQHDPPPLPRQPPHVFRQEIGEERIDGQQIDTALALGDAVEDEDDRETDQREQPGVVHLPHVGAQPLPPLARPSRRTVPRQDEQGEHH